jgi:XisI protein
MEKIEKHQSAVMDLIRHMATDVSNSEDEHEAIITDTHNKHYLLQWLVFNSERRFIDKPLLHFQIKPDGKIWILANLTEQDVAQELINSGVAHEDLVLGFHPRNLRRYTGYSEV